MHFSAAVMTASLAYGGLVSAQHDSKTLPLEGRDVAARDMVVVKSRPLTSSLFRPPDLLNAMSPPPLSRMLMTALSGPPLTRSFLRPPRRSKHSGQSKKKASSSLSQLPPIPDTLMENPNGYTVTTTVKVKPNKPPASSSGISGLRIPNPWALNFPFTRPRVIIGRLSSGGGSNCITKYLLRNALRQKQMNESPREPKKPDRKKAPGSKRKGTIKLVSTLNPNKSPQSSRITRLTFASEKKDKHKVSSKHGNASSSKRKSHKGDKKKSKKAKTRTGSGSKKADPEDHHKSEKKASYASSPATDKKSSSGEKASSKKSKEGDDAHGKVTREAEAAPGPDAEAESEADSDAIIDPAIWS